MNGRLESPLDLLADQDVNVDVRTVTDDAGRAELIVESELGAEDMFSLMVTEAVATSVLEVVR